MKNLFALAFTFLFFTTSAQEIHYNTIGAWHTDDIEIRTTSDGETGVILTARKKKPGRYTIFLELMNSPGGNDVYKVIYSDLEEIMRFPYIMSFRYSFCPGMVNSRVKKDFVYRLPFREGEARHPSIMIYDPAAEGKKRGVNSRLVNYSFPASKDEDIYAMRKGIVTRVENTGMAVLAGRDGRITSRPDKLVVVEHQDGSLAYYIGLEDGTIQVQEWEVVYPGTVIGKAGAINGTDHEIRVSVSYLTAPERGNIPFCQVRANAVEPYFLTDKGPVQLVERTEFRCVQTDELVKKEMTKKEIKGKKK